MAISDEICDLHYGDSSRPSKVMLEKDFEALKALLGDPIKLMLKLNLIDRVGRKSSNMLGADLNVPQDGKLILLLYISYFTYQVQL